MKKIKDKVEEGVPICFPGFLEEANMKAINTWSLIGGHVEKRLFYLIFGKRFMDYLFKVLTETRKAIRGNN